MKGFAPASREMPGSFACYGLNDRSEDVSSYFPDDAGSFRCVECERCGATSEHVVHELRLLHCGM
jgi:hypothetical protein